MSELDAGTSRQPRSRVKLWLKRIGLGILAALLLVIAVGAGYEILGRRNAGQQFPPPGKLVDIGGRRMHIDCRGTGSPTVVFESGLGSGGSIDWTLVHDKIAGFTRACAYDRAGIMWSDSKQTPQNGAAVADDLHATLKAAGISDQLVLVGHSIGGPYVTAYVGKYGDRVAGLVLVDASHPDQIARLGAVVKTDLHPESRAGIVRVASALSWTGVIRAVTARGGNPKLPKEARAKMAAYSSHSVSGALSELDGFDQTVALARAAHDFGDRPLVVLTAMAPFEPWQLEALEMTRQDGERFKQEWRTLGADEASWSTRGRQRVVPDATHYIQIDRPDVVIAATRDVVAEVRADAKGGR